MTETLDSPSPPSPRQRRRRLVNLGNVRTGLADCLRALEDGTMEASKARALIYGYSVLAGVIQGTELEERLAKLEAAARNEGSPRPGGLACAR
ncbi:hypothetical protein [Corallococcus macrosporus]|uniref:Uncharacterized protein n=1 Tax=Corallococcus macrosporus DSM 14697 TaxID=1189310 RepID=A0A250JLS3_9BACT|nr:hypothetical protein [Corallococcus macrosporus]ATB44839.1 hypothetical protein MYMAC_000421 [Corallococcus macrosporus DSM 14697]